MAFEPEWLYLDELLALLGPSSDMELLKSRLCRALDEGALQDRAATPAEVWHRSFEIGDPEINWASGTMFVQLFDRRQQEWLVRPIRPQFRRAALQRSCSGCDPRNLDPSLIGVTDAAQRRDRARSQTLTNWPEGQKPPSADEDEKARIFGCCYCCWLRKAI
jgi:hypothetical protein